MVAIFTGLGAGLTRSSASSLGAMGLLGSASLGRGGEGVSVNAATGNLLVNQRDEFLTGRGLDVAVNRTYNSQAQTGDRDNNDNWQMGTVRRVLNLTGVPNTALSTVQRLGGDGSLVTYKYETRGGVAAYWSTAGDGAHEKLVRSGSDWVWTDGASQVTETYSKRTPLSEWRIVSQTDISGQSLTYTYQTGNDQLDRVTTANGEWIQYGWNGNQVTEVVTGITNGTVTSTLTRTRYTYENGRLFRVLVDKSPDDSSVADGNFYQTTYDYGSNGLVTSIVQSDGSRIGVAYDTSGRVTSLSQRVDDSSDRVTTLTYNAGHTLVQGPDGQSTRLDYDSAGQLTKLTAPPAYSGAIAQVVQFDYDADGNLDSVTGADGAVTSYTYDANGNQILATDPNANTVKRWYDAGNRVTAERTYGADGVAQYTRYAYDSAGRMRFMVSPEGRVTEYDYDSYGLLQTQTEYPNRDYSVAYAEGSSPSLSSSDIENWIDLNNARWADGGYSETTIKLNYDARGNVIATSTSFSHYLVITLSNQDNSSQRAVLSGLPFSTTTTHFTYDQAGQLLSRHNEGELSETFVYDGLRRLVGSVDLNGGTTSIVFNDAATQTVITTAGGYTTTQTYNKAGDLVSATGSGNFDVAGTTTYKYDKLGRARMMTDALGINTYYVYDKAGRKVGEINHYGALTEYSYDSANRVIAETHYALNLGEYVLGWPLALIAQLTDPDNMLEMSALRPVSAHDWDVRSWTVYDDAGRVIQSIDGTGGVVAYEYDHSDRLIRTTSYVTKVAVAPLIASPPTEPVAVTAADADTESRVFYDKDGNLIGTLDGEGYLVEHVYDKAGQKVEDVSYTTRVLLGTSATDTFAALRTAAGTTARRTHYAYQGGQLLTATDALGHATDYRYNASGKLTETREYAGMTASTADRITTNVYDSAGRVATTTDPTGVVTTFSYDISGNVTKVQVGTGADARITRNWYSAGNRLRFSVDAEGYVRRYDYDDRNDKNGETTWDAPISVDDTTTIAQVNSLVAGATTQIRFAYDYDRHLVDSYDGENVRTYYQRFADGRLLHRREAIGTPDERSTAFHYDGAGRLAGQQDYSVTPEAVWTAYTYDGLGNRTSVIDPRGNVTAYTYDEVGQVKTVTDAAGGVTTYAYNAFGEVVQVTDPRGAVTTTAYDDDGRVATVTDALGYVTSYTYDAFDQVATVTRAGAVTSFEYDKLGRVTKSTDAIGAYETYTYDALGNRITSTNKLGGTTTYGYDRRGMMISETLPVASYDNAGNVVAATVTNTYAYDARGNRITMVEAAGLAEQQVTQYVYDKADRLIETVGPAFLGITPHTYMTYDARGNMTSRTDPVGARTVYFYDDADRVSVEISAVGTYTAYSYDANGNVLSTRIYETAVAVPIDGGAKDEAPAVPTGAYRETTFTYDNLNRMTSSTVTGATSGNAVGTDWVINTNAITTYYGYDANGSVWESADAELNQTWTWYDLLGRKTHQLDGADYLTSWTYDAEGNVHTETRSATRTPRIAGTPHNPIEMVSPAQGGLPPSPAASPDDRITTFTYDLVGNRLTEVRSNVLVHDGAGGHTSVSATITYTYNGLGQVLSKTENGDQIVYDYDDGGRLETETRAAFVDHTGVAVTPTVDYYYNGVGDLARTRARGSGSATERVTTYGYDGDKLRWMSDAEVQDSNVTDGKLTYYAYDAAGRQTHEYQQRWNAAGALTATYEGMLTGYDAAGRVVEKWQANYADTIGWVDNAPRTAMAYNAFGEVTSVAMGGVVQQQSQYDAAGRMVATTASDGVWKYYGYDANGNQTAAITSAGYDLTGLGFAGAFALVGQDDVNATYTQYDARNMATTVIEEGRHLSTTDTAQTLTTARTHNAFGEVASETNAAGATINYSYNTMGRLIKTESPLVSITLEDGTKADVRPTENYYYDAGGRLVASRDANGNLSRLTLLAGSGYGDSAALVTSEIHADGGVKQTKYDIHGDAREMVNELGYVTLQDFDKMGRMVTRQELRDPSVSSDDYTDTYVWDGLGQQLKHGASWTLAYGPLDYEITNYDALGRVTSSVAFGGDITTTSYTWNAEMETLGLGTFGGWVETTTMDNGLVSSKSTDTFDRVTIKTDLGGHTTLFTYDIAGRMLSFWTGAVTTYYEWLNNGQIGFTRLDPTVPTYTSDWTNYAYDKAGNRISERLRRVDNVFGGIGTFFKNQTATYDALGRMTSWQEAGSEYAPAATITNEYDAAGNIRHTVATYASLSDTSRTTGGAPTSSDYWFRFDTMNRVVVNQGDMVNGVISHGAKGQDIAYDQAGQRKTVTAIGIDPWLNAPRDIQEQYFYDAAGRLSETRQMSVDLPQDIRVRSRYTYDAAGRQESQTDYDPSSTRAVYSRSAAYNAKSQLTQDQTFTLRDNKDYTSITTYNYGDGAGYALGAVVSQSTTNKVDNKNAVYSTTANTFVWYDGALQSTIAYNPDTSKSIVYNTALTYDDQGRLTKANIVDAKPRDVTFISDALGQVIHRAESTPAGQSGAPFEVWYRFAGRQLGYTGNNGTTETSMAESIGDRLVAPATTPGTFRNQQNTGRSYADFAQSYDPLNSYNQGSVGGGYTVQSGDTLQGIAYQVWGDATLWYKIAEANGLSAASMLIEGQRLTLPTGVVRTTHNASTMRPYDPASAVGDVSPDVSPKPKKKNNKCGIFGAILSTIVAVAASYFLGPILGNVVSQGFNNIIGTQNGFSWKSLGISVVSAAVSFGVGQAFGQGALAGSQFLGDVTRGALSSAVTQGVAVATKLQDKFDWAGVAAAGIGAGVGGAVSGQLGPASTYAGAFANRAIGASAGGIANAAARSLIRGDSFGDNVLAALPEIIGQTVGGYLNDLVTGQIAQEVAAGKAIADQKAAQKANKTSLELVAEILSRTGPLEDRIAGLAEAGLIGPSMASEANDLATAIKTQLRDAYAGSQTIGTGQLLGSDGLPYVPTVDGGYAIDHGTNDARLQRYKQAFDAGEFSRDGLAVFMTSYEGNRQLINTWDQIANGEVGKLVYAGLVGPALVAATMVLEPVNIAYTGYQYAKGEIGAAEAVLNIVPSVRALGARFGGIRAAEGSLIPKIGGRAPINSKYAGQVHPSGVRFTEQGFPDFRPYAVAERRISGLTGKGAIDNKLANEATGFGSSTKAPKGYVWHHVEDGVTMQLIPKTVHNAVRHTGGAAVIRNGGFD